MKHLLTIFLFCFAMPAFAQQGNEQERLDQMPTPVTERQVETDAKKAREERRRNEEAEKKEQEERAAAEKEQADRQAKNTSTRKSSNTEEKQ
ncbi:hypothetical protein ACLI09_09865 [Flavobacterium sp. RHBU_24]|uniref:hypothetical protein n=1 Tax=Flavobacterium sp. RHBU_24 TaxID=3391185 RepID=UPI00398461B4